MSVEQPDGVPDGHVLVSANDNYNVKIYHTEACPATAVEAFDPHPVEKDAVPEHWRECKRCSGDGDDPDPRRECPICGEYRVLGGHLADCVGGDGA